MPDFDQYETYDSIDKYQKEYRMKSDLYENEYSAYITKGSMGEKLLNNFRSGIFGRKKDSDKMQAVKDELRHLNGFYTSHMLSDQEGFEAQLALGTDIYRGLVRACNEYLTARKNAATKDEETEAGQRYRLVKTARDNAVDEYKLFQSRARVIFNDSADIKSIEERPLWINVLRGIRTLHLDLGKEGVQVEETGGNTSKVLKVTMNDKGGFIKENETVSTPEIALDRYIDQQDEKQKNFSERLMLIFRESIKNGNFYEDLRKRMANATKSNSEKYQIYAGDLKITKIRSLFIQQIQELCKEWAPKSEIITDLDNEEYQRMLLDFAEVFLKSRLSYVLAHKIGIKTWNLTRRNVAVFRLAELLDVPDIIPVSRSVQYQYKNNSHKGIISEKAEGITLRQARRKEGVSYSAKALLQLNSLEILDHIVGQIDHHSGNIMVDYDEKTRTVNSLKGIDNDMCLGTTELKRLIDVDPKGSKKMLKGLTYRNAVVGKNELYLTCIDKNLYYSLLCLTEDMVKNAVSDILDEEELGALWKRIKIVRECLKNADKDKKILISKSDLKNPEQIGKIKASILNQQGGYAGMLFPGSVL